MVSATSRRNHLDQEEMLHRVVVLKVCAMKRPRGDESMASGDLRHPCSEETSRTTSEMRRGDVK